MTCNFRVGQKVVCVGGPGTPKPEGHWEEWAKRNEVIRPSRGVTYTVRETRAASDGSQRIRLMEIVNPATSWCDAPDQEVWWFSDYFRPTVDRKTDIAVFTSLLNKADKPTEVDA